MASKRTCEVSEPVVQERLKRSLGIANHEEGDLRFIRFQGTSMLPALQPDDLLVVSRNGLQRLHPGDVALFERNKGKLIAHRVLETDMSNGNVLTRGDARLFKDRRWTESDYFGRVTALFRQGKRLPVKASPGKLQWFTLVSRFWAKRMINLIRRYLKP